MKTLITLGLALSTLCSTALGQEGDDQGRARSKSQATRTEASESTVRNLDSARLESMLRARTAIHTAAVDPDGGAYGTWAAGADYKASFHDGFTFVPYLGRGYPHNQPLAWKTVSATVGGHPISDLGEPAIVRQDYRYEYRFKGLTEAYDVLAEGIEQTFVVENRPPVNGDLVITGRIDTQLEAALAMDAHQEIVFRDQHGRPIVHYGAAFAIDANGDRVNVSTSFDGNQIHLRVDGKWLADAKYPITVDPLLTRNCTAFWTLTNPAPSAGIVLDVEIARDDIANQVMVAYTRAASATDEDMWAWLFTNDSCTFGNRNQIFTDITSSWGDLSPAIAFGGGSADKWILAFIRRDVGGPGVNGIRYHLHASGDTSSNTSFSAILRGSGVTHGATVDVGGVMSFSTSSTVFMVYDLRGPGSNSDVWGRTIDLNTNLKGTAVRIARSAAGSSYTRIRPNINQVAQSGNDGWVVGFQDYWNSRPGGNDDWDIGLRRINGAGQPVGNVNFTSNSAPNTFHKMTPQVSGANGRYAVAMTLWNQGSVRNNILTEIGTDIWNETFDWPVTGSRSVVGICELTEGLVSDRRWRVSGNAYDTNSDDHWATAFESRTSGSQYVCTSGFDSGKIERMVAHNPRGIPKAFGGALMFNDDKNEFVTAYATTEAGISCGLSTVNHPVFCQSIKHLAEPREIAYGTNCGRGIISARGRNLAGTKDYKIRLSSAPANVPAGALLSLGRGNVPLSIIGMPGCALNLNSNLLILSVSMQTNSSGIAELPFPLVTCPALLCGKFYFQWTYLSPGLNALGVGATRGLEAEIRCR